ncbi:MAG TPA: serine/threonine protein kinase [Planctomycetes bacterium]|nr:serine/threonine protein kinase [Planctomycetota bacterium]HIL38287.1 serine/threonine protein kinase [Planctomycetota bacterium]
MADWEEFYLQLRKPEFVGGYEILQRLGGGAFGEAYKARKISTGKSLAIKFLKLGDGGKDEAVARELEHVRHLADIDHQNLVSIEDIGLVLDVPYLVMGFGGERTLAHELAEGPLDPRDALTIFVQVCRGVSALHERRVVHFDLKPGNIFLRGDIAKVGDYGLAKLLADGRQTLSMGRGTPQYMAPEILRSRADHRADIYSLGVVLYECLTGELPYAGEGGTGLVVRTKDDPPSFSEDYPVPLADLTRACLRLDPADRPQTVRDILDRLGQGASHEDQIVLDALGLGEWAGRGGHLAKRELAGTTMAERVAELRRKFLHDAPGAGPPTLRKRLARKGLLGGVALLVGFTLTLVALALMQ